MSETIPIFPLNTVLFPGALMPLRIFEPRYRQMLERCLAGNRRFGVVLIKSGQEVGDSATPYELGTVAQIERVDEENQGSIPIIVCGVERFRIVRLDYSLPYLVADVTLLEEVVDDAAEIAAAHACEALDRYIRLLLALRGEWHHQPELPNDPLKLLYFMGTVLLGLSGETRQRILEAEPVSNRLMVASRALSEAAGELEKNVMRSGPGEDRSIFGAN
ncbi:MAG: LON peptidase substrate-binding domain-containing protein [Chloroflexota bacterium]|nr:LON peptidase substrate-binding domain-containing protein [Chloroflexota bacterium]